MTVSPRHFDQRSETSRQIASQFGLLAICLLMLYALVVLAAILPLRLLDPGWQLRFTQALINNGFLALLGLALVHLAAYLAPSNPDLIRRRNGFATLALVPVLGFLLLIPLQGYAVWRGISNANSRQSSQLREVTGRIAAVREAVNRSSSTNDLQQRLRNLRVTPLGSAELAQPLHVLRKTMLETLERTEIRAADQLKGLPAWGLWQIIQGSIRAALSAVVLAVGFAAFSRSRGSMTLLHSWQAWFQRGRGHSRRGWLGLPSRPSRSKTPAFLKNLTFRQARTAVSSPSRRES
ncbi:hypothetical protein NZK32_04425 [Cyanobium sp. FGCU-52]|nr:hypothetical protein [Cyanobium sp. FGCU52]